MKPTVAFDVDGVLADFIYGWTRLGRALYGDVVPLSSDGAHEDWNFDPIPPEKQQEMWHLIENNEGLGKRFWLWLPILANAGDLFAMHELAREANITYITARVDPYRQTDTWLVKNDFPAGEVILSNDKLKVARDIQATGRFVAIIEDKPSTIRNFHQKGLPVFVRDWQYNRNLWESEAPYLPVPPRVSSVAEYCQAVKEWL